MYMSETSWYLFFIWFAFAIIGGVITRWIQVRKKREFTVEEMVGMYFFSPILVVKLGITVLVFLGASPYFVFQERRSVKAESQQEA